MDLVLIRHPAVAVEAGVCYGRSDVALAGSAADGAAALAQRLAMWRVDSPPRIVLTSPLVRCLSVAQAWTTNMGTTCRSDPRLVEMDFGAWEMQRWDALDRAQLDAWAADFTRARPHGGESVAQFTTRVQSWLDDVCAADGASSAQGPVCVVTHAGVMRVLAALTLGLPVEHCVRWSLDLAALVWLRRDDVSGQWTLVRWNA